MFFCRKTVFYSKSRELVHPPWYLPKLKVFYSLSAHGFPGLSFCVCHETGAAQLNLMQEPAILYRRQCFEDEDFYFQQDKGPSQYY